MGPANASAFAITFPGIFALQYARLSATLNLIGARTGDVNWYYPLSTKSFGKQKPQLIIQKKKQKQSIRAAKGSLTLIRNPLLSRA
jgi:hypothetical protein